ncbi:MAG: hypothetical protein HY608_07015 [Planctomycetes bacterium]|nr:hypothetical protein [Planctomycetota bacterium]
MRILDRFSPVAVAQMIGAVFLAMLSVVLVLSGVDELRAGIAMRRALAYFGAGQTGKAYEDAKTASAAKDGYRAPLWLMAYLDAQLGMGNNPDRFSEAKALYARLSTSGAGERPAFLVGSAVVDLLSMGEPKAEHLEAAGARFREALEADPRQQDAAVNLAVLAYRRGDLAGALRQCDASLAAPGGVFSLDGVYTLSYVRGAVLERQGKLEESWNAYGSALWLEPVPEDSSRFRGRDWSNPRHGIARGQWARLGGRMMVERGLARSPAFEEGRLGQAEETLHRLNIACPGLRGALLLQQAIVQRSAMTDRHYDYPRSRFDSGLALLKEAAMADAGAYANAALYYVEASGISGNAALAENALALVQMAKASPSYVGLELPARGAVFALEARILGILRREDESRALLDQAQAAGYGAPDLHFNRAVLQARAGQYAEALANHRLAQEKGLQPWDALRTHLEDLERKAGAP